MKHILLSTTLLLLTSLGFSQQTSVWHFGRTQASNPGTKNTGVTLDFSNLDSDDKPTTSCTSSIDTEEGSTSVGGGFNTTLFYSDGITVYDTDDNVMPNGTGLNGDPSSSQSGVAVPLPSDPNIYYLFTTGSPGGDVSYSIIDMSLNGGKGDVSSKNQSITGVTTSSEKITVIPRDGQDSYWIIIPAALESTTLKIFELTSTGLAAHPTTPSFTLPIGVNSQGYMKANQQSTQISISSKSPGQFITVSFDASSGTCSNANTHTLPGGNNKVYGLEYSASGNNLFISTLRGAYVGKVYKSQTADIDNSMVAIYTAPSQFVSTGALQLGPNDKIYFAHSANSGQPGDKLAEIRFPDNYNNPQYEHEWISFACSKVFLGLPSFIPAFSLSCSAPSEATITTNDEDFCDGFTATLTANEVSGYTYYWTNAAGDTIDSGVDKTSIEVSDAGSYQVIIADSKEVTNSSCALTSNPVTVTKRNNPTLTGTIEGKSPVCDGDNPITYTLNDDNNDNYSNFHWLTLNNGATYTADPSGNTKANISFANITNTNTDIELKVYTEQTFGTATCLSDTLTKTISIDGTPNVTLTENSVVAICGSSDNEVEITNFNGNSSYFLSVSPNTISADVVGNKIIFDVNEEASATIDIIETTANGCVSEKTTLTVNVDGCGIDADFDISNNTPCANDIITLSSNSDAGENATISTYEWDWTLPASLTLISSNSDNSVITVKGINNTNSPINVTVTHKITSSLGLTDSEIKTDIITINPLPAELTIEQIGKICVGEEEKFTVDPINNTSDYLWHTSLNTQDVTRDTFNVTNTSDDYTVFVTEENNNGCLSPEATLDVSPEDIPVLSLSLTSEEVSCNSTNNTFTINNYDANSTYEISSNEASIITSRTGNTVSFDVGETDGTISVTQTTENGCESNTATIDIAILGCGINADFTVSTDIVCSDDIITLDATSSFAGINATITDYNWSLGDHLTAIGSTNNAIIQVVANNTTPDPIIVDISLEITNDADISDDTTILSAITINPLPGDITIEHTQKICVGENSVFKVTPFDEESTYTWYTSDNSTKITGDSLRYENPINDYTVFVQELNKYSCIGTEASLLVEPEEDPILTLSEDKQTVSCNSTGNSFTIDNFDATAEYSISSSEPTITFVQTDNTVTFDVTKNAGTISVTQTSVNGCESNEASIVITVNGCGLEASFTIDKDIVCSEETIVLTSTSDPGAGATITEYKWTLPDELTAVGSTTSETLTAIATSTTSKTIDVKLEITTSADLVIDTIISVLTINPLPSSVSINTFGTICSADSAQFSVIPKNITSTYDWESTTGNIVVNLNDSIAILNGNTDYTVSVVEITDKGCIGDTAKTDVVIETNPTLTITDSITVSCNSTENIIKLNPFDANSKYTIKEQTNGISATVSTDSILFDVNSTNGTLTVLQTSANQCVSNTETIIVDIVGCGFEATFDVNDSEVCSGDTIILFSTSDAGNGATITDYNWTLPGGLTAIGDTEKDSITVVTSSTLIDTMEVELEITTSANLTASTVQKVVIVNPLPTTININKFGTICSSDEAQFSVTPKTINSTYSWTSSNNKIIEQLNVIGIKDSIVVQNGDTDYTVTTIETDSNGCVGPEATLDVTIENNPSLSLVDSITVSCNSTNNIVTINNFDDLSIYDTISGTNGITATISNDSIFINALQQNGSITIQQTSSNECESNTESIFVNVIGCGLEANFTATDSICSNETITLDGTSSNAGEGATIIKYDWSLPNSMAIVSANADSSIVTVSTENLSDTLLPNDITLTIITDADLSDDTTKQEIVIIKPLPNQPTITQDGGNCPLDTALFIAGNTNGHTLIWSATIDQFTTQGENQDTAIYINGNTDYTVNLVLENNFECRGTSTSSSKNLDPLPSNIQGIFGDTIGCNQFVDFGNDKYLYEYVISAENATFEWSSESDVSFENDDITNDTVRIWLPYRDNIDAIDLSVTIKGTGCSSEEIRTLPITIDTTFALDINLVQQTVCEEDSSEITLSFGPNDFPSKYLEDITIDWYYNNDTLHENKDSLYYTHQSVQIDDSIYVQVSSDLCIISGSNLDHLLLVDVVTRPGGDLLIDGEKESYQSDLISPSDIILTDDLYPTRILTSENAEDSIYQFYWVKDNGQLMNDTVVVKYPENVEMTPPNCDRKEYEVIYYMVTSNGICYDTSTATLNLSYGYFIPNAFTPNNDGEFDTWNIESFEKYGPVKVEIFNRWGGLIYNNDNYMNTWEGINNNGDKLPFGTYFYIVDFNVEGLPARAGSVSIIK